MEHYVFNQLRFVRQTLLTVVDGVTEETAHRVPDGFRNTIHWNLGHIYVVFERFAFQFIGLPMQLPEGFKEQFENGTSPLTRPESVSVPSLEELKSLLAQQNDRVQAALEHRLQEPIDPPYTTSAGMLLGSPEQFLTFNLYHEGMHLNAIKQYKAILSRV
ncbi:DinB family protein [Paenibacillus guangzhouensis]|uniref:DinB family protein n=1 Tax=Paenibacillus guangzhouensis TaxID=1473112 RepID=UPI00187B2880|nr:DinB family protein [Paenibacillus guangzhouensis]